MGFIRNQQIKITVSLLQWKYKNDGLKIPDKKFLNNYAGKVVDEAKVIAKKRGLNILSILKELVKGTNK